MDQKRYAKHLAKKKASHERRTKRVHELDAHPRIYEKPPTVTATTVATAEGPMARSMRETQEAEAAAEAPNGN